MPDTESFGFFDAEGTKLSGGGRGVLLRQQSPTRFSLEETFTYRSPEGEWAVSELPSTDLASVPWPIRWFLPRYGRHTLAALLHDDLVGSAGDDFAGRRAADRIFFDALAPLGVPILLRVIMWIAVTIQTRWNTPDRPRTVRQAGIGVWVLLALWGISNFVAHVAWWDAGPLGQRIIDLPPFGWSGLWLSFVLPAIAAPLWGRDAWPQGLAAIVPGFFVVPVSFLTAISYGIYWLLETIFGNLWASLLSTDESAVGVEAKGPLGPKEILG